MRNFEYSTPLLLQDLVGGLAMSFVPATLAIDPAAFLSTIFAAVAAGLTFLIVLLIFSWGSDRVQGWLEITSAKEK